MASRLPHAYEIDPTDPRAPSLETWESMSPKERERLLTLLPSEFELDVLPPEGDPHALAAASARFTLDGFFRRAGRKIYVSSNLAVYYPGERCIAPDVIAVRDVEPHEREKWVVAAEGKGLDFALEVLYSGDRKKDEVENVKKYAKLGIEEYFLYDRRHHLLRGYRLPSGEGRRGPRRRAYVPILPQEGRLSSEVLGLDLAVEGERLRFFHGPLAVLEADELVARLGSELSKALAAKDEVERLSEEVKRAKAEAKRAKAEATRAKGLAARLAQVEKEFAETKRELERLRRAKKPIR
jgi:Uma2 family endonuclease